VTRGEVVAHHDPKRWDVGGGTEHAETPAGSAARESA
jgi:hypothetical protein